MASGRFIPRRAIIEESALNFPLGRSICERLEDLGVPTQVLGSGARLSLPAAKNPTEAYEEAKHTLVVRVRKAREFASCKPSAHYQLPLVSSCPGMCEYCYLQTRLGPKPYVRVYANLEDLFSEAQRIINSREPDTTVFEGAATADPVPLEHLTGSLEKAIEFFGRQENALFRFVTKFHDVEPILKTRHNHKTTVRFSLNADYVIRSFEHNTSRLSERIDALCKVKGAGYPVGVMIGPIMVFESWQDQYDQLFRRLGSIFDGSTPVPFELITHRYTTAAKNNILSVFPNTRLPMDEADRRLAFGQFGYTKYVYPKETMETIRRFFEERIGKVPGGCMQYMV